MSTISPETKKNVPKFRIIHSKSGSQVPPPSSVIATKNVESTFEVVGEKTTESNLDVPTSVTILHIEGKVSSSKQCEAVKKISLVEKKVEKVVEKNWVEEPSKIDNSGAEKPVEEPTKSRRLGKPLTLLGRCPRALGSLL